MSGGGFWPGRRVLLTGHTGFKGAWLAALLARKGAKVFGYALAPDGPRNLFADAGIGGRIDSTLGDIRDPGAVQAAFAKAAPEIVFHLAAQALVRPSYEDPAGTFETNVMGTIRVLEGARRSPGVRAFVNVTSDKCYENGEAARPFRESDPMGGSDPYSGSKGCAELVTAVWRRSFLNASGAPGTRDIRLASVRAGNVIGGGDWAKDRLVPDCVRALERRESVRVRQPAAVRPWQHVLDPLAGYLLLAERLLADGDRYAQGWNFGPLDDGAPRAVSWMVREIVRHWGEGASWSRDEGVHPAESAMLRLDSTKAARELGWRPRLDAATAVGWTVDWYRRFLAGEPAASLMDEQIERHERIPETR